MTPQEQAQIALIAKDLLIEASRYDEIAGLPAVTMAVRQAAKIVGLATRVVVEHEDI